ncbi:hypothetical protein M2281_001362 [Mesorhizobium soli]|nr:DUF3302 domain-containing protein [Mesorhizobium soli]MDH6230790.1 hypothetical protein [Mesorhizobium soli]
MIDKIGDPFLNNFALGLLLFIGAMLFYGIIAIHDIPHKIAEKRNHPHQDAIHAAGWVSLFTLHVLWPFLWIWAMAYRPDRGWGFSQSQGETGGHELDSLRARVEALEKRYVPEPKVVSINSKSKESSEPELKRSLNVAEKEE